MRFILPWPGSVLFVSALLTACAGPNSHDEPAVARAVDVVDFGIHGALPLVHTRKDPLIASRVGLGPDASRLRYEASFTIEPGDLFAEAVTLPGASPPERLAGRKIEQKFGVLLPELAGAPVALTYSTQARQQWKLTGESVEDQRQLAELSWAPGNARVNLKWAGNAAMTDSNLALGCGLAGTLRLPLHESGSHTHALRISGRDCRVLAGDPRYADLGAQTRGVAWSWTQPEYETEILLSAIDPYWRVTMDRQPIDPSYELGLIHRRDHGDWSARTSVAIRHTTAWDLSMPMDARGHYHSEPESFWTASTSLTRSIGNIAISGMWAHSVDPMWFIPEVGQRKHRLQMKLDLSGSIQPWFPDATPQLVLHWEWSQARSRNDNISGERAARIQLTVFW